MSVLYPGVCGETPRSTQQHISNRAQWGPRTEQRQVSWAMAVVRPRSVASTEAMANVKPDRPPQHLLQRHRGASEAKPARSPRLG